MCIECHTPRDDNGDLVTSRYLEGAPIPVSHVRSKCRKKMQAKARILPIPTRVMDDYVRQIQMRLRGKKIGYRKEFLREILKEVRVRGNEVRITYRLPISLRTPHRKAPLLARRSSLHCIKWWSRWESNPRPLECHSSALPTELRPHDLGRTE